MAATRREYEPPAIVILGTVESLTKVRLKTFGEADGIVLVPDQPLVDASIVTPN